MQDDKLAEDEARRATQHAAISLGDGDVNAEIAARANRTTPTEAPADEQVAGESWQGPSTKSPRPNARSSVRGA